jgi:hypothetical protein
LRKKVRLYGRKEVRAAAYNRLSARHFLELAERQLEGRFFASQASLVFSAFTHEAFLNTLGPKVVPAWAQLDRASPWKKLTAICDAIGYRPHKGRRPYVTLKRLLRFRNLLAHGRHETVEVTGKLVRRRARGYMDAVAGEWESYCTVKNARRAFDDVCAIAEDLFAKAKIEDLTGMPFGSPASTFFRIEHM